MPILKCPKCNGRDIQAGIDKYQCLTCGTLINSDGTEGRPGMDENTREQIKRALDTPEVNVVGNLADLQRLGGKLATDENVPEVELPPGVTQEQAETGLQDPSVASDVPSEPTNPTLTEPEPAPVWQGDEYTTTGGNA